jgi:hypothetical protein
MAGGWSAHLEFQWQELRVRTDFVTRPPRLHQEALQRIWRDVGGHETPFLDAADLADMKKTNREKDYVVIGELARRMADPDDRILYSRSARDLIELARQYPDRVQRWAQKREALEAALDAERRQLIRANEERLARYLEAAKPWAAAWPSLSRQMDGLTLPEAHQLMVRQAETLLPFTVPGGWP